MSKAFTCGEADGGVLGGSRQDRERAHAETPSGRPREGLRKRLKRKMVEWWGERDFIDVESGGWPVHAPYPMRRALNPGGQTPDLRLLLYSFYILFIFF